MAIPRRALASLFARTSVRWTALVLVSVVTVGTAVYSYRDVDHELTTVALSRRETVAQLAAVTLGEKLGRVVDVAVSLATRVRFPELVEQGRWVEAIEIMHDVPRNLPHIERLFLADLSGTLRADVPALPDVRGVNFAHRDWFQGVTREGRPYVSPAYIRQAAPQRKVFAVAAPVRSAAGRTAGILVLQIRLESLLEWVAGIELGPGGFIYIVDSRGQLAFDSRAPDREALVDASALPVADRLRRGATGVEIALDPTEREDAIVAYAVVPGHGWSVVAQQPAAASLEFAARDAQLSRLLAGYGVLLLLGAVAIPDRASPRLANERGKTSGSGPSSSGGSPSAPPSSRRPTGSSRRSAIRCPTTCARRCARSTASGRRCSRTAPSGWTSADGTTCSESATPRSARAS